MKVLEKIKELKEENMAFEMDVEQSTGKIKTYYDVVAIEGTKVTLWEKQKTADKKVTLDLSKYDERRINLMY